MKRGFSLFEILLVLFVMSMIVIGGIQYANRKQEESSARQLGQRLYQYGIAVAEYVRINPDKHTGEYEEYGYEWLKNTINPETCTDPNNPDTCDMFLGKDFNLKLQALHIATLQGDPDKTDDQLYTKIAPDPVTGTFTLQLIELGTVYRYSKDDKQYEVDLSLPGRAATFANEYFDQYGGSRVTYTVESFNAGNDIDDIHIVGFPNTSGPNVDAGFLRTDGSNQMDGDLTFSSKGNGVLFKNGDKISATKNLGSNESVTTHYPPQNRDNKGSSQSKVPEFRASDFQVNRRNAGNAWIRLTRGSTVFTQDNSFCMLTGFEELTARSTCRVTPATAPDNKLNINTGDWVLFLRLESEGSHQVACFARCLLFRE